VRNERYKLTWNTFTQDSLLFDLQTDHLETKNIYVPTFSELNKLLSAYQNWQKELIEPTWPAMIYYRFKDEDGTEYWFEN
jgi:hypothetical protein